MSEYPIQSFIELVSFDQATYALEDKIQQMVREVELLEKTCQDLRSSGTMGVDRLKHARKEVDQAELTMKTLERQEQEAKEKLEKVTSKREYQAALKEIEKFKQQQHEFEKTLVIAWNKFEAAKKEEETRQAGDECKNSELVFDINQKREALLQLRAELDQRVRDRELKKANVPAVWLEKYVLMRSRVTDPVVPVVNGSCSACFYNLPAQEMLFLSRNKLIQCKGCYRFLYTQTPKE
jgi:uncharacterized protein